MRREREGGGGRERGEREGGRGRRERGGKEEERRGVGEGGERGGIGEGELYSWKFDRSVWGMRLEVYMECFI